MEVVDKLEEIFKTEHDLDLNKENDKFIEIFNYIANIVSKKEYQKNKNTSAEYINDKILKEVLKHVLKNKEDMIKQKVFKTPQVVNVKANSDPVLKTKWIYVDDAEEVPIDLDVHSVKFTDVHLKYKKILKNYNIKEDNDIIVIREKIKGEKELYTDEKIIKLEHGNYTIETLINELNYKFSRQALNQKYNFYTDDITKKFAISSINLKTPTISMLRTITDENACNFEIIPEKSTILETLGFSPLQNLKGEITYIGESPIDLAIENIPNFTRLTVSFDDFFSKELILSSQFKEDLLNETLTPYEHINSIKINNHESAHVYGILEILYYVK